METEDPVPGVPIDGFRIDFRVRMATRCTERTALKIEHLSLMATVVIAFAALAALVFTGQAGIREDLRISLATLHAGQDELRRDIKAVETELRKDMRAGRAELRKDLRSVEAELRAGQAEIRKEMQAIQAELRREMKAGQAELHADFRVVEAELRAGQVGIRKDLKAVEVRLAVVEQRTAGLSGETGASAAEPAPAASPEERHHSSARAALVLARAVTAPFGATASMAAGGPIH